MKHIILILITFSTLASAVSEAGAFWGSDSNKNLSGLDVAGGYDVNTVAVLSGKVLTSPAKQEGREETRMTIHTTDKGAVTVLLGPWSYWEKQGFTITPSEDVSITGSIAQGKDGSTYIFAQKLENKATGGKISLRSESGIPNWSRSGATLHNGIGQNSGRGIGGAAGYRGGGGYMRGGGRR